MAGLDAQLSSYNYDIKRSETAKKVATNNFDNEQKAVKNQMASAARDYNLTTTQYNQESDRVAKQQIIENNEYNASIASATKAKEFADQGVAIDHYSANITADKQRLPKPVAGPMPPRPIKYPRTVYADPRPPQDPPKPVKGVAATGNMIGAVGSGLSAIGGINFGGIADALKGN